MTVKSRPIMTLSKTEASHWLLERIYFLSGVNVGRERRPRKFQSFYNEINALGDFMDGGQSCARFCKILLS